MVVTEFDSTSTSEIKGRSGITCILVPSLNNLQERTSAGRYRRKQTVNSSRCQDQ